MINSGNGNRILSASGIIGISGSFTPGTGSFVYANSTIDFNGSGGQTVNGITYNNLTISNPCTAGGDITVNGTLDLNSANASATKGALYMGYSPDDEYILYMGPSSTTTGIGDVSGYINRSSFVIGTDYTFGNQFTLMNFTNGPLPNSISLEVYLTSSDIGWKTDAIHRYYDVTRSGGSPDTRLRFNVHYLDSELNGALETVLDLFDYHVAGAILHDHGRADNDAINNWVGFSNVGLVFLGTASADDHYWTLGANTTSNECTWVGGSPSGPTDWDLPGNWQGGVPGATSNVIIPSTAICFPVLPHSALPDGSLPDGRIINSIEIQTGGILNATIGTPTLTINGAASAWINHGAFHAGASNIVFSNAAASMNGETNFNDITVANGGSLTMETNNIMKIGGLISLEGTGKLSAAQNSNTIDFNGANQTIIIPNGTTTGYYNLNLSGSGTKTIPANLTIYGTLSMEGSATIAGSCPDYNSNAALQYKGSASQITGVELPSTFDGAGGLIIDNSNGVTLGNTTLLATNLSLKQGPLIINPDINLTVEGTTYLGSAECLMIKSNSTSIGSFIDNGLTGSGTAKVERWVKTNGDFRWEYISSPVSSTSSSMFTTSLRGLWYANETVNAWVSIPNTSPQNMIVMKGYARKFLAVEGDGDMVKTFTGQLNSGDVSIQLTGTTISNKFNGWNLVGNPYPSNMDWNATSGWTKTNLDDAIYFRTNGNFGSYISGVGTNGATQYIPPMQAFWVRVSAGHTTSTLGSTNEVRVHNTQYTYKSTISNTLQLVIANSANSLTDDTYIRFNPDATDGFDGQYDAFKMFAAENTYPQLYTGMGSENISINTFGEIGASRSVPLGFNTYLSGQFVLTADKVSSFTNNNVTIYLEDLQTGTYQDLSVNRVYQFSSGITSGFSRFLLHFNQLTTSATENDANQIQINASNGEIYISSSNMLDGEINVYDVLGQMLITKKVSGSNSCIIYLESPPAVYILKYSSKEKTITKKIGVN